MYGRRLYLKQNVLILVLWLAGTALKAQTGFVKSANTPIPGATVTALVANQKFVTTTDRDGRYVLPTAADGECSLEVRMFGFEPAAKKGTCAVAEKVDFNLQLQESPMVRRMARLGAGQGSGSTIESQLQSEINAPQNTPSPPPVDGQNSNEAFLVSGSLSQGLASNGRPDFAMLEMGPGGPAGNPFNAQNVPGFGGGSEGGTGGRGGGGFGGRGGPGGGPGFGRGGHGRPGAQFGNRRGPSSIHGMAFFTLDNSALNAKPFSITGQQVQQPAYAQSRFGFLLGGPLVIPKIIKDQSTFFYLNYTGTRSRQPNAFVETVPSALERQGNFSQSVQSGGPVQIYDTATRQPFPGNVIPAARLDPVALKLLTYFPLPNQPGLVNNYQYLVSTPQNSDNLGARLMRDLGKSNRLAYRLNLQRRDGNLSQPFGFLDTTSGYGVQTDLTWTHNFTPRTINSARVDFNRNRIQTTPFFANGPDVAAALGIAGASRNPLDYGPPNLNFTNFGSLSDANPVLSRNQSQRFTESVILSHGNHSITIGMQYSRNDLSTRTDQNGRGTFNFTGLATSLPGIAGVPLTGSGFDFADFLLGLPQSASVQYGNAMYFTQNAWNGFVMDDWKVNANLTLNLGLRYEFFAPLAEKYGRMANLDIAPGYAAVAVVTAGAAGPYSGGFPAGLIDPDYRNFSPRLGLAWKVPFIKRSTIVRAGYGIYYNGQAYNPFALKLAQQPPFAVSNSVNTSAADILTLAGGFVAVSPQDITNTFAVDRGYRTPYAQTWNFSIQHDLGKGFITELGYLGTKGTRLDILTLPNEGPGASLVGGHHQLGNAIGFTFDSSNGDSIYHAVQTRLMRRFRSGISMNAHYTFSKSIDNSSSFGGAGNTVAQNWLDLAAERGLSSFDRRHVFDMNWVITSPFGTPNSRFAGSGWSARLLKDWSLSGGITAETGTPLTARVLGNTARLAQTGGIGSGRADATGADLSSSAGFFNLAAFAPLPPGAFGNAGRNTIPGPGLVALNAAFGRSFQFGDTRRRLEFRFEANNILNHVSFTNINTVVNASNYGLPISAAPMRSVDMVVRFRF